MSSASLSFTSKCRSIDRPRSRNRPVRWPRSTSGDTSEPLPDASDRTVVGMNLDVLMSMAQLDLGPEPMVLSVPDNHDRFWSIMWLDAWNDVPHVIGTRATGGKGGDFAAQNA